MPQSVHLLPSVRPVLVHVGETPATDTPLCPVAATVSVCSSPQRTQVYFLTPLSVQVGCCVMTSRSHVCVPAGISSTSTSLHLAQVRVRVPTSSQLPRISSHTPHAWPSAGRSVGSTIILSQRAHLLPALLPFSVQVGLDAGMETISCPSIGMRSVYCAPPHTSQAKVRTPSSSQVAGFVMMPSEGYRCAARAVFSSHEYSHSVHLMRFVPCVTQVPSVSEMTVVSCAFRDVRPVKE